MSVQSSGIIIVSVADMSFHTGTRDGANVLGARKIRILKRFPTDS